MRVEIEIDYEAQEELLVAILLRDLENIQKDTLLDPADKDLKKLRKAYKRVLAYYGEYV